MKATLTIGGKEFDVEVIRFEIMTDTLPSAEFIVKSNIAEFEQLALSELTLCNGKITCNE